MFDAWERDVGENNDDENDDDDDDDDDDYRMMCIREWCVAPGIRRHLISRSPSILHETIIEDWTVLSSVEPIIRLRVLVLIFYYQIRVEHQTNIHYDVCRSPLYSCYKDALFVLDINIHQPW